jgi:hypothetical protein
MLTVYDYLMIRVFSVALKNLRSSRNAALAEP